MKEYMTIMMKDQTATSHTYFHPVTFGPMETHVINVWPGTENHAAVILGAVFDLICLLSVFHYLWQYRGE